MRDIIAHTTHTLEEMRDFDNHDDDRSIECLAAIISQEMNAQVYSGNGDECKKSSEAIM